MPLGTPVGMEGCSNRGQRSGDERKREKAIAGLAAPQYLPGQFAQTPACDSKEGDWNSSICFQVAHPTLPPPQLYCQMNGPPRRIFDKERAVAKPKPSVPYFSDMAKELPRLPEEAAALAFKANAPFLVNKQTSPSRRGLRLQIFFPKESP